MQRPRLDRRLEPCVQLVVERAGALHRRDVLRDAREVDRPVVGHVERAREVLREIACAVEPDHGTIRPASSAFTISPSSSGTGRGAGSQRAPPLPQDLGLEAAELGPGSMPSSSTKRARASWYASSASAWRPDR